MTHAPRTAIQRRFTHTLALLTYDYPRAISAHGVWAF